MGEDPLRIRQHDDRVDKTGVRFSSFLNLGHGFSNSLCFKRKAPVGGISLLVAFQAIHVAVFGTERFGPFSKRTLFERIGTGIELGSGQGTLLKTRIEPQPEAVP